MAYSPKVSDSALAMGVTASETRQGGSQQYNFHVSQNIILLLVFLQLFKNVNSLLAYGTT